MPFITKFLPPQGQIHPCSHLQTGAWQQQQQQQQPQRQRQQQQQVLVKGGGVIFRSFLGPLVQKKEESCRLCQIVASFTEVVVKIPRSLKTRSRFSLYLDGVDLYRWFKNGPGHPQKRGRPPQKIDRFFMGLPCVFLLFSLCHPPKFKWQEILFCTALEGNKSLRSYPAQTWNKALPHPFVVKISLRINI